DYTISTTDSGVPLDINGMMQRTYDVRNGSQRYQALILPKLAGLNNPDMQEKMRVGHAIQDLMHVVVMVHFNRVTAGMDPPPSQNKDLQIPGATYSYKVKNDFFAHGTAYTLLFGNWHDAKWSDAEGGYHFTFVHKKQTHYIENIE